MNPTGKAKLAGVMGWPVSHSRSPRLHGYWLDLHGIDGAYVPLAVAPENLEAALRALPKLGFKGCNLTIPHKKTALAFVDHVDETARALGAVNTIVVQPNGELHASNSDVTGFAENLREKGGILNVSRSALVIGAGGAARSVIAALKALGYRRVVVVNRTVERAQALAGELSWLKIALDAFPLARAGDVAGDASLIVNTTSLGMTGEPALTIDLARVQSDTVVTDIVYTPLETPLLAAARALNLKTVDGLGMLLHQARPGFRAWFGVDPQVTDALRAHVMRN